MARYSYLKSYAQLTEHQLKQECVDAGLPVIDVQRLGDDPTNPLYLGPETILIDTSRDLTSPELSTLATLVTNHDGRPRRIRSVFAIYQDLLTLNNTQQDAIIADLQLTSLTGKWTGLKPPQDAPAASFRWAAVSLSGATAGEKRQAAGWIISMWCQQNPKYLVNPTFHISLSGVNIPGDEVIP